MKIIPILLGFAIVMVGVMFLSVLHGCANNPALDYVETTAQKLQPVHDGFEIVCPIAIKGAPLVGEDGGKVRDACQSIDNALKAVQAIQEIAVIAAGGEPCLENCSNSSTE